MTLLNYLGHLPLIPRFLYWIIVHMSFAIPMKRINETATLTAFFHPVASYSTHILIVPKRAVAGLEEADKLPSAFWVDLVRTVQALVAEFDLEQIGYRLIVNGGKYQEFPYLHFHLVSGKEE
jgi:diadenosine tetraphosphate (Ap4A) HIT family hydrolase